MNLDQAISTLKQNRQANKQLEADSTTNAFAKSLNTFKDILVDFLTGLLKVSLDHEPRVTVKNFPKQTTIENKKLNVEVLNFPKKEPIEKVEVVNQKDVVFNTAEIEKKLKDVEMGVHTIAPQLKTSFLGAHTDSKALLEGVIELKQELKKLKLNPEIKVTVPKTEVPAPIVNMPEMKMPAFPKKMEISNMDFTNLENKLDEVITELQYNAKQPVKISNPGDFPVSPTVAAFKDSSGVVKQGLVDGDNHVQVDVLTAPSVTIDTTGLATETTLGSVKTAVESIDTKIDDTTGTDGGANPATRVMTYTSFIPGYDNVASDTVLQGILTTLGATNATPDAYTTADWLLQIKASIDSQLAILNYITDGTPTSLGQGTMAESQKVVIASDQTPVNVIEYSLLRFSPNDIDVASATVTYIGTEDRDGVYLIKKIDTSSGTSFTYATIVNNGSVTTYADAWAARDTTLTYGAFAGLI
jgi:hypothetical protein